MERSTQEGREMTTVSVKFTKCGGDREKNETRVHLRESLSETIEVAVAKIWGRAASWWADAGLGLDYGQVVGRGGNCLTPRTRVDITDLGGTRLL
jgi:hypothetical protein